MGIKDIPVVGIGPGSQPAEEDGTSLEYISMPKEMASYQQPDIPEPEAVMHLAGAREAMNWLREALENFGTATEPLMANISNLDADNRELVNQILGEGEVGVNYTGTVRARIQESVLAGVWRTFYLDQADQVTHDLIEVGDVPYLARVPDTRTAKPASSLREHEAPEGVMNAMAILTELAEHCERFRRGQETHVINLTLLPLSDEDVAFLDEALGRGPVHILSRAYGKCEIISTAVPHVWWVRYYNSMGTIILNSLEVVDTPLVACAAPEDLDDSKKRLNEILEPYWADIN